MGLVEKTFRQGEVIIKEGDIGKSFFRIIDGKAGVYAEYGKSDPMRLAVLEAGEYFGEMAIIEEYPRSATIVAIGNVTVVEIPGDELSSYFTENPDQIMSLMKHLAKRISSMTNDYYDAKKLLDEVRATEEGKKKSLFSKIKKHIDIYQNNKNKMNEPNEDALKKAFENFKDDNSGKTETFTKGKIFYKEGEVSKGLYILKGGEVSIYNHFRLKDEVKSAELKAVAIFGEMGMLGSDPRGDTAVSESDETVVEIVYQEDLESMFKSNPAKIDMILRHLSYRLRKITLDFLSTCKEITENYNGN